MTTISTFHQGVAGITGGWIVTYASGTDLYYRRYHSADPGAATEALLAWRVTYSAVAGDGGEGVLVAFVSGGVVYAALSEDEGATFGPPTPLEVEVDSEAAPAVVVWRATDGLRALVAWGGATGLGAALYARGAWTALGNPSTSTSDARFPSLAVDPATGRMWCAWRAKVGTAYHVRLARSDDDGATWTLPAKVVGGMDPSLAWDGSRLWLGYHTGGQEAKVGVVPLTSTATFAPTTLGTPGLFVAVAAAAGQVVAIWSRYAYRTAATNDAARSVAGAALVDGSWVPWPGSSEGYQVQGSAAISLDGTRIAVAWSDRTDETVRLVEGP